MNESLKTVAHTTNQNLQNLYSLEDNLWFYGGIILISVGTVGHLLSIAVVSSSRSFRTQSSSVFVIALSAAGILALLTGLLRYTIFGYNHFTMDIRHTSLTVCKIHVMLTYMSLQFIA